MMSFSKESLGASELFLPALPLVLYLSRRCRSKNRKIGIKMLKLFIVFATIALLVIIPVDSAPQLSDVELKEQAFNRINEAEYDYK
jgi:hypothetical protein